MRSGTARLGLVFTAVGMLTAVGVMPLDAGTIRHDRPDSRYTALAGEPQFAAVGRYDRSATFSSLIGSLTLIHPSWALTAAHVVDWPEMDGDVSNNSFGYVKIGGETRQAAELIVPTGVGANRGWRAGAFPAFDIALVRLESPITTITPAKIYTSFQELGKVVTMVGFGQTGDGTTGSNRASGTKRAGQNLVDELLTMENGATGLRWDFDEPEGTPTRAPNRLGGSDVPLDLEYQVASGDSGGGSFIFENGEWWLAGVHSASYDTFAYPGTTNDSHTYGDLSLATRVAAYQEFIYSHIPELAAVPEPASMALLVMFGTLLARRRAA